jgi:hypothetical protein
VRLSWAQKRDLAGQGLAALITSFLIAAPLALSLPGPTPEVSPVAVVTGAPVVMPALPSALPSLARRPYAPRRHDALAPDAVTAAFTSPMRALAGQPIGVATQIADATPAAQAAAVPASVSPRRTFGRRLANLFAGDGSVPIRPFPSVAER